VPQVVQLRQQHNGHLVADAHRAHLGPPRAAVKRFLKRLSAGRARADYLACYHMNVASAARRERFVREVQAGMRGLMAG
jgi:hypothetical protein